MRITPEHWRAMLGVVLASVLVAGVVFSDGDDPREVVQPVIKSGLAGARDEIRAAAPNMLARLDLGRLDGRAGGAAQDNPFASKSWYRAPPPLIPAAPALKPAAPAIPSLPFTFIGRMTDARGKTVVFLLRADTVHAASVGEALGDDYRLETMSDDQLGFVYLPSMTPQSLNIQPR